MKKERNSRASKIALILCAVLVLGIIGADFFMNLQKCEKTYTAMGTVVTAKISGKSSAEAEEEIRMTVSGIETSCLSWRVSDSDVSRINASCGDFASVSSDTANWISDCCEISEQSGHAFDITVGKVTKLWNFDGESNTVPDKKDIESALEYVDCSRLFFNETGVKEAKGQFIDMGAVGKGIACDCARKIAENYGVKSAIVSVGGSVLIYGGKASVGIINPWDDAKYIGTIKMKNQCVSTSGDYERFFEKDGKTYHHIIDPATGYPVENDLRSVTVICDSGLKSDALSTACFVMGYKSSLGLLNRYDAEAVYVFKDKTVAVTDGLKDNFRLTDSGFKMK